MTEEGRTASERWAPPSARVRRLLDSHDVVGAAARLAVASAVATLLLVAVTVLAPASVPASLVAMTAGLAKVFAVAAGAGVLLWVPATLERGAASERLVDEVTAYLAARPTEG